MRANYLSRKEQGIVIGSFIVALLVMFVAMIARAQPSYPPAGEYGFVTLPAAVATAIPFALAPRKGISIQNNGPGDIYCGWDNAVTNLNGFMVARNGGVWSADVGFDTGNVAVFCYSAVLQVAPNNTRYVSGR